MLCVCVCFVEHNHKPLNMSELTEVSFGYGLGWAQGTVRGAVIPHGKRQFWGHLQAHCEHTQPLNGPLSGTTRVSRYQKGKTPPLRFLQAGCPSCRPTNSVKALKGWCIVKYREYPA